MKNCPLVAALTSNLLVIQLDMFDWNLIQSRIYNDILWVFTRCVYTIRLKVCIWLKRSKSSLLLESMKSLDFAELFSVISFL